MKIVVKLRTLVMSVLAIFLVMGQYQDIMEPVIAPFERSRQNDREPIVFFITPTHKEYTQLVDLTRMSQFLQLSSIVHNHNIYWMVIEDRSTCCSRNVRQLLQRSGLIYAHLYHESTHVSPKAKYGFKSNKGINQRNHALDVIESMFRENTHWRRDAVIYFADGDNAYDSRLLSELIRTSGVSVLPVGFTAKMLYERCVVDVTTGLVTDFIGWRGGRKFPVDMAGFSFSLKVCRYCKSCLNIYMS